MKAFIDRGLGDIDCREGLEKCLASCGYVLERVEVAGKKISLVRALLSIGEVWCKSSSKQKP